jgi:4-hydroxybenzoate polyprenyltransferase/phosphoserine phosphatase
MTSIPSTPTRRACVVDLDDTLVRTDLLYEQFVRLIKTRPLLVLRVPLWCAMGIRNLKARIAAATTVDVAHLPYRQTVLDKIRQARAAGETVLLASASHESVVQNVHDHLQLFDGYLGTGAENLKGARKLAAIRERLGGQDFAYFGDSQADLAIWRECAGGVACNPSHRLTRRLAKLDAPVEILRDRASLAKVLVRQLRVHQWVKNLLIFLPVVAAHRFRDADAWAHAALAFVAFCCLASAVYVVNDLLDVESDRAHQSKRRRPFASGDLSLKAGLVLAPILLVVAGLFGALLPSEARWLLAAYLGLNFAYSLKLKEHLGVDLLALASFYAVRVLVGGAATDIAVSQWLTAFCIFFFFGLASAKRYTELKWRNAGGKVRGRGYHAHDEAPILALGSACSVLATLVLVLYLDAPDAMRLYSHPSRLVFIAPLGLYWSARIWLLAHRGTLDDDPVVFSLKDRATWAVLLCTLLAFVSAI